MKTFISKAYPELELAVEKMLASIDSIILSGGGSRLKEPVKMYLAGGMAMNFYCGSRYTEDVDAFFSKRILIPSELHIPYRRKSGEASMIYFDTQYNPYFGLIHEDAEDDAINCIKLNSAGRLLNLYLLNPTDLAVTKISRYSERDVEDIMTLAKNKLIKSDTLRLRAEEAMSGYIGNLMNVKNSINLLCNRIQCEYENIDNQTCSPHC